jgi:hypothetical protein
MPKPQNSTLALDTDTTAMQAQPNIPLEDMFPHIRMQGL